MPAGGVLVVLVRFYERVQVARNIVRAKDRLDKSAGCASGQQSDPREPTLGSCHGGLLQDSGDGGSCNMAMLQLRYLIVLPGIRLIRNKHSTICINIY